jgi:hypothetical protein
MFDLVSNNVIDDGAFNLLDNSKGSTPTTEKILTLSCPFY